MTTSVTPAVATASSDALPKVKLDFYPVLLIPALVLLAIPLIGSFSTWVTLTVAGLAMGMIIFVMTSGLTLVFGLMNVLNFGHSVFITLGAFLATTVLAKMTAMTSSDSVLTNLGAIFPTLLIAMIVVGIAGWVFERVIIRRVYGDQLKQILTTMGGMIIGQELILAVWGSDPILLPPPTALQGSWIIGGAVIEKYRLTAATMGVVVFAAMFWVLNYTKIGLLIRAGVQNREMVESLGYRIRSLFIGVFIAGSALAGMGGVMWGLYEQTVNVTIGASTLVLSLIVIIIGGMGSTGGCFIGALLIGLLDNYIGFVAPKLALISNILVMVLVLLWRPQGLYPVVKH